MKKLIIFLLLLTVNVWAQDPKVRFFESLTTGKALKGIVNPSAGDISVTVDDSSSSHYTHYFVISGECSADDSPWKIYPTSCATDSNKGYWKLPSNFYYGSSAEPGFTGRDSDYADDIVLKLYGNSIDGADGHVYLQVQQNDTPTTYIDLDGAKEKILFQKNISVPTAYQVNEVDFVNQDVTSGAAPTFTGTNFSSIPDGAFSAYSDLETESKIGTLGTQVAAGDHTHSGLYPAGITESDITDLGTTVAMDSELSDHTGDTDNPHSVTYTQVAELTNVTHVPLSASINDYITAASSGDTLLLSAGIYTITSSINVNKQVNIVGQGNAGMYSVAETDIHGTVIYSVTDNTTIFNITASNVRLSRFSIYHAGAGAGTGAIGVAAVNNLSGLSFSDIDVTMPSSAGIKTAFDILGSQAVLRDISFYLISSNQPVKGIYLHNDASTTANVVVDCHTVTGYVQGGATYGSAYFVFNDNDDNTVTLNLLGGWGRSGSGTENDNAAYVTSNTTNNAVLNIYNSTLDGADYDIAQTGTNPVTFYGAVLVHGTASGTGTLGGKIAAASFSGTAALATSLVTPTTMDNIPDGVTYQKVSAADVGAASHLFRLYDADETHYVDLPDLSANKVISTTDHNHSGTYEPADATIVKDSDFANNGRLRRVSAGSYGSWVDNLAASAAPTATDDSDPAGYSVGSIWLDTTNKKTYICIDSTDGAAVWKETSSDPLTLGTNKTVQLSGASGVATLAAINGSNNENLTINLESVANEATIGSGTGVSTVRLAQGIAMNANMRPAPEVTSSRALTVLEMNGQVYVNGAYTVTLPEVVASPSATQVSPGAAVCIGSVAANVIRVNPHDNDGIRLNMGTRLTNGYDIYSAGAIGNFICLEAGSVDGWTTWGRSGVWTAGS